jgi:NTP pyrophosphatase (non-canonical NTP hydrolase)
MTHADTLLHDMLLRVMHVSSKDSGTMADRVIKLQEEVGEIASSYGTYSGYKLPKKVTSPEAALENIKEECIDSLIVILDILTKDFQLDSIDIYQRFAEKCDVWETVVRNKNASKVKVSRLSRWKNIKTGNFYVVTAVGRNSTNEQDGQRMVSYIPIEQFHDANAEPFHREITEFQLKFELVENSPLDEM